MYLSPFEATRDTNETGLAFNTNNINDDVMQTSDIWLPVLNSLCPVATPEEWPVLGRFDYSAYASLVMEENFCALGIVFKSLVAPYTEATIPVPLIRKASSTIDAALDLTPRSEEPCATVTSPCHRPPLPPAHHTQPPTLLHTTPSSVPHSSRRYDTTSGSRGTKVEGRLLQ